MCRLKYYKISEKFGWHLAAVTSLSFLILGAIGFGYGLKLMEYAEKKDLTPVFAGVPMLLAGVLGAGVALSRKKCIVTSYSIMCVVVIMLSIHMNYRFMVKEFPSIPQYKRQCQLSKPTVQQHCNRYAGTVILCCVSVAMVPVAVAGFLACLVAYKNFHLVWFTFSKVVPAQQTRKTREQRHNACVELTKYSLSSEYIGETLPQSEYLPRIPDFMELAIHNSNPDFRDSLILENEELSSLRVANRRGRKGYSKSLENLVEQNRSQERLKINGGRGGDSNVLSAMKDNVGFDQRRTKGIDSCRLTHSDLDLRLIEQDFLNRKNHQEDSEYYDSAAEYWMEKMVDNFKHSRSRLNGVSDEEDLDSDNEPATDKINDTVVSTTKPLLSTEANKNDCVLTASEDSTVTRPLLSKENNDRVPLEKGTENKNSDPGFSTNVNSRSQKNLNKENTSYFEENFALSRRDKINVASSSTGIEQDDYEEHRDDDIETADCKVNIQSQVQNFKNDLTPPGLATPMVGNHSPRGQLHFEFDKNPSGTTEHARKNWIEFEGEEDRKMFVMEGE